MVLYGKHVQEYLVNTGVPQDSIIGRICFQLYINDLPDNVMRNIASYDNDTTVYSKFD